MLQITTTVLPDLVGLLLLVTIVGALYWVAWQR
jgi:hypothetical protein